MTLLIPRKADWLVSEFDPVSFLAGFDLDVTHIGCDRTAFVPGCDPATPSLLCNLDTPILSATLMSLFWGATFTHQESDPDIRILTFRLMSLV